MKFQINVDPSISEDEVIVNCRKLSHEVERLISALQVADHKLSGLKEGQTFILDPTSILYIDTVDRRVFLYTKNDIFESRLKLYMLEEQLAHLDFFRAGKSSVINLRHIKAIKADVAGRLLVTVDNEEQLVVSRQYAGPIKERLGI